MYLPITSTKLDISIVPTVTLLFGLKHITRQVPTASAILKRGSLFSGGVGAFGNSAGKSLVKTYVLS